MSNFKFPDELLGGAVKVIRPTDLRNRVGMYMMEERGVKMGRNIDPGDVQDMIVEFTQREMEKLATPASTARTDGPRLCAICTKNPALKPHGYCQECYTQWYGQTEPTVSVPQAEPPKEEKP